MGLLTRQPPHPSAATGLGRIELGGPISGTNSGLPPPLGHRRLECLEVRVRGLQARPELNGLVGTLVAFDAVRMWWYVDLGGSIGEKCFKVCHLELVSAVLSCAGDPVCPLPVGCDAHPGGGDVAERCSLDATAWKVVDGLVRLVLAQRKLEEIIRNGDHEGKPDHAFNTEVGAQSLRGGGANESSEHPQAPLMLRSTGSPEAAAANPVVRASAADGAVATRPNVAEDSDWCAGRARQSHPWMDWSGLFTEMDAIVTAQVVRLNNSLLLASPSRPGTVDILIFGSTGHVGLTACALMLRLTIGRTWAIAGRNGEKLGLLSGKFGDSSLFRGAWQTQTPRDVERSVRLARVVIDLSAPCRDFKEVVVEACARAGTHYVEATSFGSSFPHAEQVGRKFDRQARAAGACLVFFCGTGTSLDLATWMLVKHMRRRHRLPLRRVAVYDYTNELIDGTPLSEWIGDGAYEGARISYHQEYGVWGFPETRSVVPVIRASRELFRRRLPYGDAFTIQCWHSFSSVEECEEHLVRYRCAYQYYGSNLARGAVPKPGQGFPKKSRTHFFRRKLLVAEADAPGKPPAAHLAMSFGSGGIEDNLEESALGVLMSAACLLEAADSGRTLRPGFGTPSWHLAHLGLCKVFHFLNTTMVVGGKPSSDFVQRMFDPASSWP